jgi:uncharacterized protein YggT (Ycf19 family)
MLDWIRGKRFDLKTTVIVIAVALAVWAVVVYVNLRDFVPDELTEPIEAPR